MAGSVRRHTEWLCERRLFSPWRLPGHFRPFRRRKEHAGAGADRERTGAERLGERDDSAQAAGGAGWGGLPLHGRGGLRFDGARRGSAGVGARVRPGVRNAAGAGGAGAGGWAGRAVRHRLAGVAPGEDGAAAGLRGGVCTAAVDRGVAGAAGGSVERRCGGDRAADGGGAGGDLALAGV